MASRSWAQERAKRRGGTNIRGNKRERHERSKVSSYTRKVRGKTIRVKSFYRHKGKRRK